MILKLREMVAAGHPATSIAVALAPMSTLPITAQSVRVKCCELGIRLKRCDGKYRCEVRCTVAMDVWEKLRKLANTRGLSVSQFAQLFIEIAVDERLIGKIIDDPVPQAAPGLGPQDRPPTSSSRDRPAYTGGASRLSWRAVAEPGQDHHVLDLTRGTPWTRATPPSEMSL